LNPAAKKRGGKERVLAYRTWIATVDSNPTKAPQHLLINTARTGMDSISLF
jgi:hypothetical protein